MNSKSTSLWTRLVDSLRIKPLKPHRRGHLPEVDADGLLAHPAELPADHPDRIDTEPSQAGDPGKSGSPLSRWSKREQAIVQLQEGYERMTGLMEDIQKHMVTQGDRGDRICNSLEQLANAMSDHPKTSQEQSELLKTITAQIDTANTRNQHLAQAVSEIPKLSKAQNETLGNLNRRLDMANEQNVIANQTLDRVGSTLNSLGDANSSQAEAIRDMNDKTNQQNELLTTLIAAQSKRFTMLFVVTLILAAAAVATAIVSMAIN